MVGTSVDDLRGGVERTTTERVECLIVLVQVGQSEVTDLQEVCRTLLQLKTLNYRLSAKIRLLVRYGAQHGTNVRLGRRK